jgi:hypothetical protein
MIFALPAHNSSPSRIGSAFAGGVFSTRRFPEVHAVAPLLPIPRVVGTSALFFEAQFSANTLPSIYTIGQAGKPFIEGTQSPCWKFPAAEAGPCDPCRYDLNGSAKEVRRGDVKTNAKKSKL